jgi:hypothetical protein
MEGRITMKILKHWDIALPDYSASYLINGDSSGLDPDDIVIIDDYMEPFYAAARELNGSVVIYIQEDNGFTWGPAFGLACDTYKTSILILG